MKLKFRRQGLWFNKSDQNCLAFATEGGFPRYCANLFGFVLYGWLYLLMSYILLYVCSSPFACKDTFLALIDYRHKYIGNIGAFRAIIVDALCVIPLTSLQYETFYLLQRFYVIWTISDISTISS